MGLLESELTDTQISVWLWARVHVLRPAVAAVTDTGVIRGSFLDLIMAPPGFLNGCVKESSVCFGGGLVPMHVCMCTHTNTHIHVS